MFVCFGEIYVWGFERKTERKASRAHLAHLGSNGPHVITMIIIRVMFGFQVKL